MLYFSAYNLWLKNIIAAEHFFFHRPCSQQVSAMNKVLAAAYFILFLSFLCLTSSE